MITNTGVKMARTEVVEDSEHNPNSGTLYKVSSRKKVRNILVDCNYFENKGIRSPKNITFTVSIKVFAERRGNKPIYYELYGNTMNSKYNHMLRITSDYEIPLREGDVNYYTFKGVTEVINSEFDDYTTSFINCTKKLIQNTDKITKTPQFILEVIEKSRRFTEEKVINRC